MREYLKKRSEDMAFWIVFFWLIIIVSIGVTHTITSNAIYTQGHWECLEYETEIREDFACREYETLGIGCPPDSFYGSCYLIDNYNEEAISVSEKFIIECPEWVEAKYHNPLCFASPQDYNHNLVVYAQPCKTVEINVTTRNCKPGKEVWVR